MSYDHEGVIIDQLFVIHDAIDAVSSVSYLLRMANDLFNMRLSEDFLHWLDEMRRKEPDIPTRSEMARRCIERQARAAGVLKDAKRKP